MYKRFLLLIINKSSILVGGQAVIEGVMMRVPGAYATAVRDINDEIIIKKYKFTSLIQKHSLFNTYIIRGIIGLFESLKIGFNSLQWSADINMQQTEQNPPNKVLDIIMTIISIILALSIFFISPIALTTYLFDKDQNPLTFNLISGIFRVSFFLIYLILISFMKDVKILFQYHGAEHKTVYNFESGKKLSIENAHKFPTQHPRCGTSFLFIIMIVAIISFAILDSILIFYLKKLELYMRLIIHIPFIPLIAGLGYEILKLTSKYRENIIFKLLAKPGLLLQNITTKNPTSKQLEVALKALSTAFGKDLNKYQGKTYLADAIE